MFHSLCNGQRFWHQNITLEFGVERFTGAGGSGVATSLCHSKWQDTQSLPTKKTPPAPVHTLLKPLKTLSIDFSTDLFSLCICPDINSSYYLQAVI